MKNIIHGFVSFTIVFEIITLCGREGIGARIMIALLAAAQYVNGFTAAMAIFD